MREGNDAVVLSQCSIKKHDGFEIMVGDNTIVKSFVV